MKGQLSLYDIGDARRPCDYHFVRYIGQRVRFFSAFGGLHDGEEGSITDIGSYYTYIKTDNGENLIATPTTIFPIDPREKTSRIKTEGEE